MLDTIYSAVVYSLPWSRWVEGRADGERGFPPADAKTLSGHADAAKQHFEKLIADIHTEFLRSIVAIAQMELHGLKRLETLKTELEELRAESHAWPRPRMLPLWAYLVNAAILIVEVPVNFQVFQILGENKQATYVMAMALGIVLAGCALAIAIPLRDPFPKTMDRFLGILAILVVAGTIGSVYIFRSQYFQEAGMDTKRLSIAYVFLQVAFLSTAVFVDYHTLDPFWSSLRKKRGRYDRLLDNMRRNIDRCHGLARLAASEAQAARQSLHKVISAYRVGNIRARADARGVPPMLLSDDYERVALELPGFEVGSQVEEARAALEDLEKGKSTFEQAGQRLHHAFDAMTQVDAAPRPAEDLRGLKGLSE